MRLIILGLRRSGTTITWQTFRQDRRLLAFNEPFNELIRKLPDWDEASHYSEFQRLIDEDASGFWNRFAPIPLEEELDPGLTEQQADYFHYLLEQGEHTAFDLTRCHFKVDALHALAPDAVLVHLFRRPASHASSHMLPSRARGWRGRVRRALQRSRFWTRRRNFDFWSIESIVGNSAAGPFGRRLTEIGLSPREVYAMPAVGKLMAFWRVNFEKVEADGRRCFGDRFLSVPFEDFCTRTQEIVSKVYAAQGLTAPELDYSGIRPPNRGYLPDDPRWQRYRTELGLTERGIRVDTGR